MKINNIERKKGSIIQKLNYLWGILLGNKMDSFNPFEIKWSVSFTENRKQINIKIVGTLIVIYLVICD